MSKFVDTKMRHDAFMADLLWNDMVAEAKVYLINKHLANGDLHITEEGIEFIGKEENIIDTDDIKKHLPLEYQ